MHKKKLKKAVKKAITDKNLLKQLCQTCSKVFDKKKLLERQANMKDEMHDKLIERIDFEKTKFKVPLIFKQKYMAKNKIENLTEKVEYEIQISYLDDQLEKL